MNIEEVDLVEMPGNTISAILKIYMQRNVLQHMTEITLNVRWNYAVRKFYMLYLIYVHITWCQRHGECIMSLFKSEKFLYKSTVW